MYHKGYKLSKIQAIILQKLKPKDKPYALADGKKLWERN